MKKNRIVSATIPMRDYQFVGGASDYVDRLQILFGRSSLLQVFDSPAVSILSDYMRIYRQPAGGLLLKEGEQSDFAILLLEGEVAVLKAHANGSEQQIATIAPGRLLGEMALIDMEPRFATCRAISDTQLAVMTRQSLLDLLDEHPKLGSQLLMRLVALVSTRLRQTSAKLVELMASIAPDTDQGESEAGS